MWPFGVGGHVGVEVVLVTLTTLLYLTDYDSSSSNVRLARSRVVNSVGANGGVIVASLAACARDDDGIGMGKTGNGVSTASSSRDVTGISYSAGRTRGRVCMDNISMKGAAVAVASSSKGATMLGIRMGS